MLRKFTHVALSYLLFTFAIVLPSTTAGDESTAASAATESGSSNGDSQRASFLSGNKRLDRRLNQRDKKRDKKRKKKAAAAALAAMEEAEEDPRWIVAKEGQEDPQLDDSNRFSTIEAEEEPTIGRFGINSEAILGGIQKSHTKADDSNGATSKAGKGTRKPTVHMTKEPSSKPTHKPTMHSKGSKGGKGSKKGSKSAKVSRGKIEAHNHALFVFVSWISKRFCSASIFLNAFHSHLSSPMIYPPTPARRSILRRTSRRRYILRLLRIGHIPKRPRMVRKQ